MPASAEPTIVRLQVGPEQAGLRLDGFLAAAGFAPSVQAARRLLDEGRVRVDGRRAPKGLRLHPGQQVELTAPAIAVSPGPPPSIGIIHVDDDLIAIDKPAGLPSVGLHAGDGWTAAAALVARFPECAHAAPTPLEGGLAHRLDTGTSGVLLAARRREVWRRLREIVGGGAAEKDYYAEVVGHPAGASLVIAEPIGRSGRRGAVVEVGAGRGLLPARTEVELVATVGPTSLVLARLHKGRPHQVRAHLAHIGCPILGDPLYGTPEAHRIAQAAEVVGFRLHALRVTCPHPTSGAAFFAEAPRPDWVQRFSAASTTR